MVVGVWGYPMSTMGIFMTIFCIFVHFLVICMLQLFMLFDHIKHKVDFVIGDVLNNRDQFHSSFIHQLWLLHGRSKQAGHYIRFVWKFRFCKQISIQTSMVMQSCSMQMTFMFFHIDWAHTYIYFLHNYIYIYENI